MFLMETHHKHLHLFLFPQLLHHVNLKYSYALKSVSWLSLFLIFKWLVTPEAGIAESQAQEDPLWKFVLSKAKQIHNSITKFIITEPSQAFTETSNTDTSLGQVCSEIQPTVIICMPVHSLISEVDYWWDVPIYFRQWSSETLFTGLLLS